MNDNFNDSNSIFYFCGQNILYIMYSLLKISIVEFITIMFLVISHY